MRKTLTDKGVAALKPRPQRFAFPDPQLVGHYVRIQPSGAKTFVTVARSPAGKQVWTNIGAADVMSIDEAREKARHAIKRVRDGLPAFDEPPRRDSFQEIAEGWLKRHAEAKGLRSLGNIRRLLRVHVFPKWSKRPFLQIRRSDVTALLDHVEDNHGARQADLVLTVVRSIMNWHAKRHDDYAPPIVKGMGRQNQKEQSRARILTDDEIRSIWKRAEGNGRFGAIIRLALLTAQRRTKIASMKWDDLSSDGEWNIPKESREKDTAGTLKLPEVALDIIRAQPRLATNPHVFAGREGKPFSGFSVTKTAFDASLPDLESWVIHDLRRTARSLMSRAGVRPDIAERVMGHAIAGVEGVYDRHEYRSEKADALQRLATLVATIVNPPTGNVRPIRRAAR
jgi:integrase